MNTYTHLNKAAANVLSLSIFAAVIGCSNPKDNSYNMVKTQYAPKPANLLVQLTDAPNHDLKNVWVNIKHIELWLEKGGQNKRLVIGQNLGMVDLLTLQNGVNLPVEQLTIGAQGINIKKIHLLLQDQGHYAIKSDDSRCDMATPSGQQTGLKIHLHKAINIEQNYSYSMVIDFDAKKSVVVQGNGDCLLKPVLRLKTMNRTLQDNIDDDGNLGNAGNEDGYLEDFPVVDDGSTTTQDPDSGTVTTTTPDNGTGTTTTTTTDTTTGTTTTTTTDTTTGESTTTTSDGNMDSGGEVILPGDLFLQ